MKKYNGMITIVLAALCSAGITHAEQEDSGFDYKKLTPYQKGAAIGLGTTALGALGLWGIPKIREWWGGPVFVYNKYVASAKDTFIRFTRSFYDEESPFNAINKKFKRGSIDQNKEDKITSKNDLKDLLETTISDINSLCMEFKARSKTEYMLYPIFLFALTGFTIAALQDEATTTKVVGSVLTWTSIGQLVGWLPKSNSILHMGEKLRSVKASLEKAINAFANQYKITVNHFKNSESRLASTIKVMASLGKKEGIDENLENSFKESWEELTTRIARIESNLQTLNEIDINSLN